MDKYFRMFYEGQHYYGVVNNIPEGTNDDTIEERIQTSNEKKTEWIKLSDEEYTEVDISFDWEIIDCEIDRDKDMSSVLECIDISQNHDLTSEVVYTALKYMKENPELSISESIEQGLNEWLK